MACAPYLATRTLKQLVLDEGHLFPLARQALDDFYVDDCLTGASSVEEAIERRRQITELLKRGGFSTRKWATNDPAVLQDIPPSERAVNLIQELDPEASMKTLGVRWNFGDDTFTFSSSCDEAKNLSSKRDVLSMIARIFDPLGLIGPVIIPAKAFMQELWQLQIDWTDPLPASMVLRWSNYLDSLRDVENIRIPRRCISIGHPTRILLHGYCDASNIAYGAALYLRTIDEAGNVSSRLLCSKSKVAPINTPTIPRLELCAAVLLARLIETVKAALRTSIHQTVAWSDSTTTLAWIAGPPAKWKTFVSNRVAEIISILPAVNWRHISGTNNPADLLSRGLAPSALATLSLWWEGPEWDDSPLEPEVKQPTAAEVAVIEKERRKQISVQSFVVITSEVVDQLIHRYSSFSKLVRITAWIIRFITNCQRSNEAHQCGPLTVTEQEAAKVILIRYTQQMEYPAEIQALEQQRPLPKNSKLLPLSPFLDDGLLR
ncbi:uncharacterized protein LOC134202938, partial [Armigeres subalbatus]|uniref:uncharacterized protein LOC134202938 n=1 Tax=Armigeres subalbatus TaxID=124917 RepID=UPI002ED12613